jgi:hypothetical protein
LTPRQLGLELTNAGLRSLASGSLFSNALRVGLNALRVGLNALRVGFTGGQEQRLSLFVVTQPQRGT